jgi:hypothetical protein
MRKYEFKAKELDSEKWVFGYYYQDEDLHFIMGLDNYHYSIDPSTLCQLITEINRVKIFEYDCWYDPKRKYYKLYEYDENGFLYQNVGNTNKKGELINWYICEDGVFANLKYLVFIGNWHDGKQYLLDKIKELGNE